MKLLVLIALISAIGIYSAHRFRVHQRWQRDMSLRAEGLAAAAAGDHQRVVKALEEYLPRHSSDLEPLLAYVRSRPLVPAEKNKHLSDTIIALRYLMRLQPDRVEERRQLLNLFIQTGYFAEALDTADLLIDRCNDRHADTLRGRTLALARLRRFVEAEAAATQWVAAAPSDLEAVMLHLSIISEAKQPNQRIREAAAAAFASSNDPRDKARSELVQGYAALLMQESGGEIRTIEHLTAAAAAGVAGDREFDEALVKQLDAAGLSGLALDVVRRMDRRLGTSELHYDLARRCWEAGRLDEVVSVLGAAVQADANVPSDVVALHALSLQSLGRPDEADTVVQSLKSRSDDAAAAAWALVVEQARGTHVSCEQMIRACQLAIAKSPNDRYLRLFMGEAYAQAGEDELAVRTWREAAEHNRTWPAPLVRASQILLERGRLEAAHDGAAAAVRRGRDNFAAQLTLARAWVRCLEVGLHVGNDADLLARLDALEGNKSSQTEVAQLRATVLAAAGRKADAQAIIRQIMATPSPIDEAVLLRLADTSRRYDLELESECLELCKRDHGDSPMLAFTIAARAYAAGLRDDGLKHIEQTWQAAGGDKAPRQWQIDRARFLELVADARAKEVLIGLADGLPDDAAVQELALAAHSTGNDFEFRARAIARLRRIAGEQALNWRIHQAKVLLEKQPDGPPATEAMELLADVVARAPHWADAHALLASGLQRQGKFAEAMEHLRLARSVDRNGPADSALAELYREAHAPAQFSKEAREVLLAAEALAQKGNDEQAAQALAKLDAINMPPAVREMAKAEHFARHDKLDHAIGMLQRATSINPADAVMWRMLVRYEVARGKPEEAAHALRNGLLAAPNDESLRMIDQQKDLLESAKEPALRSLAVAFIADPSRNSAAADALRAAWQSSLSGESQARVCERLEEIADRAPQLVAVQILLAQKYLEREVPAAARAAAAQAAMIAPDLPAPYRLLVEATAQEGKWVECLDFARQLRERLAARPLEADLIIAKAYLALQRPDDARAQLKPYLVEPSSPAYADAVMALSEGGASAQDISALVKSLVEQGPAARIVWMTHVARNLPSDQAAKWLRQTADVIPPGSIDERVVLAQSWGELASTTGEANYAKEARAILEPLAANPDAPGTVLLAWANQLDQDGDFPAAEELYRRVIAAGPSPVAQNNLAMLLARGGEDLPEACKLIDEAIALAPEAAPLYDTKAFVLSKGGDLQGAVDSIHQAIELRPSNPEYRVHLAELLLRKGEREKVREAIADLDKRHVALKSLTQPVRQRLDNLRNALSEQAPVKGAEI